MSNRHGFRTDVLPQNLAARLGMFAYDVGSPMMAVTWVATRNGCGLGVGGGARGAGRCTLGVCIDPPTGHHAGPDFPGGYCFLNNGVIAAQVLPDGGARAVAVLDVDYHHGNGTQTIFYERADVLTLAVGRLL